LLFTFVFHFVVYFVEKNEDKWFLRIRFRWRRSERKDQLKVWIKVTKERIRFHFFSWSSQKGKLIILFNDVSKNTTKNDNHLFFIFQQIIAVYLWSKNVWNRLTFFGEAEVDRPKLKSIKYKVEEVVWWRWWTKANQGIPNCSRNYVYPIVSQL